MWDSEKRAYAEMSTASVQQVAVVSVLSARHRCLRATFERCALFILLQMMGRAGRPGFDTSGTAVIMTSNEKAPQWRQISAGAEPIESQLLPNVAEVLVSEAAQHVIRNIADAIEFLKSTFLFTRLKRNPGRYGLPSNSSGAALDTFLNESVLQSLNLLSSAKILGLDEDGFGITIHDAAPIMSKVSKFEACTPEAHHTSDRCCCAPQYVVRFSTMRILMLQPAPASLTSPLGVCEQLEKLCECPQLQSDIRYGQKGMLNELNKNAARFRFVGKISSPEQKASMLVSLCCPWTLRISTYPPARANAQVHYYRLDESTYSRPCRTVPPALSSCKWRCTNHAKIHQKLKWQIGR